jgi:SAM-dependent methyltransferase
MRPDPELLNAVCPWCGSHVRHRALWLYLERRTDLFTRPARLLHVAPEHILQERLRALSNVDYLSADLDSPLAMQHFDLTDVPHPDDSFDAIVCSHVLEHVPDDRAAMRELSRILRPDGWAIVQVPIDYERAETLEDPAITTPEERERAYWQADHMRLYANDFPDRLRSEGMEVTVDDYLYTLPEAEIERYGLVSLENIYVCRPALKANIR